MRFTRICGVSACAVKRNAVVYAAGRTCSLTQRTISAALYAAYVCIRICGVSRMCGASAYNVNSHTHNAQPPSVTHPQRVLEVAHHRRTRRALLLTQPRCNEAAATAALAGRIYPQTSPPVCTQRVRMCVQMCVHVANVRVRVYVCTCICVVGGRGGGREGSSCQDLSTDRLWMEESEGAGRTLRPSVKARRDVRRRPTRSMLK